MRFPFPRPRLPSPYAPRRLRRRNVGIIGAITVLLLAVAGAIGRCGPPAPGAQLPAPGAQHPAPGAQNGTLPVRGGAAISDPVEVREIQRTLAAIRRGPPWPFPRADNEIYENWGTRLPHQPRGFYRAFTVVTPSEDDRGPRRLVLGRDGAVFFTRDHYKTFVQLDIEPPPLPHPRQ